MNGNRPKARIVLATIFVACTATNSYANPQVNPKSTKPAATKASVLTEVPKGSVRILAQANTPAALPLYLPPSRGQVRVRSSAATRGTSSVKNPTLAALDL